MVQIKIMGKQPDKEHQNQDTEKSCCCSQGPQWLLLSSLLLLLPQLLWVAQMLRLLSKQHLEVVEVWRLLHSD